MTRPAMSSFIRDRIAATPRTIAVCASCPHACILPRIFDANGKPAGSSIGSASMSARIAIVGPGAPPCSNATIPVLPMPVRHGMPSRFRNSSTRVAVCSSSNASSGCSWILRRNGTISSGQAVGCLRYVIEPGHRIVLPGRV
jgi:hypothetical protein